MMQTPSDKMNASHSPASVVEPVAAPRASPQAIGEARQQMALLEGLVRDVLRRGIDYGRVPGALQDSLWGPGAATIISVFNCYPGDRRILSLRDDGDKIAAVVEVPLVSLASGRALATGVGAASTMEARYRPRWVTAGDARRLGYDEQALRSMEARTDGDRGQPEYRIPNLGHGELLNAILKMASKRAEVDAADSLPGVAPVLRHLFTRQAGHCDPGPRGATYGQSPVWSRFWGEVQRLGLTQDQAHHRLGVTSMKEWLAQNRSLDEAAAFLVRSLVEEAEADLFGD